MGALCKHASALFGDLQLMPKCCYQDTHKRDPNLCQFPCGEESTAESLGSLLPSIRGSTSKPSPRSWWPIPTRRTEPPPLEAGTLSSLSDDEDHDVLVVVSCTCACRIYLTFCGWAEDVVRDPMSRICVS